MSVLANLSMEQGFHASPTFSTLLRQTCSFFGDVSAATLSLLLESDSGCKSFASPRFGFAGGHNPATLSTSLNGLGIMAPVDIPGHEIDVNAKQENPFNIPMDYSEAPFTDSLELEYPPSNSLDALMDSTLPESSHHDFWSTSSCSYEPDMTFGNSNSSLTALSSCYSIDGNSTDILDTNVIHQFPQDAGINPSDIMLPSVCSTLPCGTPGTDGQYPSPSHDSVFLPMPVDSPAIKAEAIEFEHFKFAPAQILQNQSHQYAHGRVLNRKRLLTDSPEEPRDNVSKSPELDHFSHHENRDASYQPSSPIPEEAPSPVPSMFSPPTHCALDCSSQPTFSPPLSTPSPVLNAHAGIDLVDLLVKAARYRARCPGQDIDNNWLMAYAGKLTKEGALLDDFRCYVNGCNQTNKRRDHIVVHVGSHVDQRPYRCDSCDMRFLRKNECKRHQASHSNERPYVCHICPPDEKKGAFIRRDLLQRHLKRSHGIGAKSDKENRPVKKARTMRAW
ncbi:hypothetical protein HWV62_18262 [Athelia sp. TMB]|nr:hypothetical protein HWV62_18262 [Athelia sp. TMB]